MILILPLLSLAMTVYIYQTALTGDATYYYYKIINLFVLPVGIYFIAIATAFINGLVREKTNILTALTIGIGGLILITLGTHQSFEAYYFIPQRNSKVTGSTASEITKYLRNGDFTDTKIIVLTDRSHEKSPKRNENFNGDLASQITHTPYTCVFYVLNNHGSRNLSARLNRLDKCAAKTDKNIVVITNNKTRDKVLKLNRDNIRVITVK